MVANTPPRVAIVHDWLVGGGAELVVEQLHKLYPEAPIYTSYASQEWRERLDGTVRTGWLQHFGAVRKFMVLGRIWWFTRLDLRKYDLVISSSGAEAKAIRVPPGTVHINYCHAPTHYYWSRYEEYLQHPGLGAFDWLGRIGLRLLVGPLRRWDFKAAQRPDFIIANSSHTQADILRYYQRDSTVIHPPIYLKRFQKLEYHHIERQGFVISGRQTAYKRFDLAIQACSRLGLPLTVIGTGPDTARLKKMAGPTIHFAGRLSDTQVELAFASANAFLFPGLDDFGITPLEAMAAGTPVIAYQAGGALDYVIPGKTGSFFKAQTVDSIAAALTSFRPHVFTSSVIAAHATQFSDAAFRQQVRRYIATVTH